MKIHWHGLHQRTDLFNSILCVVLLERIFLADAIAAAVGANTAADAFVIVFVLPLLFSTVILLFPT